VHEHFVSLQVCRLLHIVQPEETKLSSSYNIEVENKDVHSVGLE
jgi:hypothetical protein